MHIPLLSPSSACVCLVFSHICSYLTTSFLFFFFFLFPVCNCSGKSDQCAFDAEQYRSTGSGGRCLSCTDNTDGPHCERCRENHYRSSAEEPCLPCNCSINGTFHLLIVLTLPAKPSVIHANRIIPCFYLMIREIKLRLNRISLKETNV